MFPSQKQTYLHLPNTIINQPMLYYFVFLFIWTTYHLYKLFIEIKIRSLIKFGKNAPANQLVRIRTSVVCFVKNRPRPVLAGFNYLHQPISCSSCLISDENNTTTFFLFFFFFWQCWSANAQKLPLSIFLYLSLIERETLILFHMLLTFSKYAFISLTQVFKYPIHIWFQEPHKC